MVMSWFRKLIGGAAEEPQTTPAKPDEQEFLDDFRSYIAREIAAGYNTPEEALEIAIEVMSDDLDLAKLNQFGPKFLSQELEAHIARQADWPEVTDYDRLNSAFRALEEKGIVSRQNFTCCGTCGSAEIWDEIEQAQEAGKIVRGYTFFHQQDTESAAEGYGLYLNYGSIEAGSDASVAIGNEIQGELNAHGLTTDWDGKISMRIGVSLDWKRRIKLPASNRLN